MSHIYIHYPYCLYKCHYCDFNSHAYKAADIPQTYYADALLSEIELRRAFFEKEGHGFLNRKDPVTTIFFGGGTPSLMNPKDVEKVLTALQKHFTFADDIEITLESNPGTVTLEKFREFHTAGINRISLGVQSLNDKYLKAFGRIHSADEALQAIQAAQNSGVKRVSADLIFGFPSQKLEEWESDLQRITTLGLKHVSAYALTAEEGTQYTQDLKRGHWRETESELFADMQEFTYQHLQSNGLEAYEISNFAQFGEESRHNLGYWHYRSYLGLGAGAYSNFIVKKNPDCFVLRHMNHKVPEHYMRKIQGGAGFFVTENISHSAAMQEFIMMGLRLKQGIALCDFENLFSRPLKEVFTKALAKNLEIGRLQFENDRLKPTSSGFLFNNAVIQDFFADLS